VSLVPLPLYQGFYLPWFASARRGVLSAVLCPSFLYRGLWLTVCACVLLGCVLRAVQNTMEELWTLMNFLMPHEFASNSQFVAKYAPLARLRAACAPQSARQLRHPLAGWLMLAVFGVLSLTARLDCCTSRCRPRARYCLCCVRQPISAAAVPRADGCRAAAAAAASAAAAPCVRFGELKKSKQVEELQKLIRPFILRRLKEDVEKARAKRAAPHSGRLLPSDVAAPHAGPSASRGHNVCVPSSVVFTSSCAEYCPPLVLLPPHGLVLTALLGLVLTSARACACARLQSIPPKEEDDHRHRADHAAEAVLPRHIRAKHQVPQKGTPATAAAAAAEKAARTVSGRVGGCGTLGDWACALSLAAVL
jgi:hypothetical protein